MASVSSASKAYAKALFETAQEEKTLLEVADSLEYFKEAVFKNADFRNIIESELVSTEEKIKLFDSIESQCQFSKLFSRFIRLLFVQKRIALFEAIASEFVSIKDESEGVVRGVVTTTNSITPDQINELEKTFSNKFKKTVKLAHKEDNQILGGLVVEIGDLRFDGSLKTALVNMKNSLERQYV